MDGLLIICPQLAFLLSRAKLPLAISFHLQFTAVLSVFSNCLEWQQVFIQE